MKAVITDLDWTLLRTDKTISENTLEVLKRCREKGIRVIAATARPERVIGEYQELVAFDAVITLNGARNIFADGTVEQFDISHESVRNIMEQLDGMEELVISMETDTGIYSNVPIPAWEPTVLEDFAPLLASGKIFKILVSSKRNEIYDRIGGLMTEETYYTLAENELIQIMSKKATKRNAVEVVLRDMGIAREDAVYFGDDNDDIECIRWCGRGVAVSNAIPAVREAADHITGSNDEDGVAEYLREMYEAGCKS